MKHQKKSGTREKAERRGRSPERTKRGYMTPEQQRQFNADLRSCFRDDLRLKPLEVVNQVAVIPDSALESSILIQDLFARWLPDVNGESMTPLDKAFSIYLLRKAAREVLAEGAPS